MSRSNLKRWRRAIARGPRLARFHDRLAEVTHNELVAATLRGDIASEITSRRLSLASAHRLELVLNTAHIADDGTPVAFAPERRYAPLASVAALLKGGPLARRLEATRERAGGRGRPVSAPPAVPGEWLAAAICEPLLTDDELSASEYVARVMSLCREDRAAVHGLIVAAEAAGALEFPVARRRVEDSTLATAARNAPTMIRRGPQFPVDPLFSDPALRTEREPEPDVIVRNGLHGADAPRLVRNAVGVLQRTKWRTNLWLWDQIQRHNELPGRIPIDDAALDAATGGVILGTWHQSVTLDPRGRYYDRGGGVLSWSGGGGDLARALMEFVDDSPLTETGRLWLGRHVAGLFGAGKTLEARDAWIADPDNQNAIRSIVGDPWNAACETWMLGRVKPKEYFRALVAAEAWVNGRNAVPITHDCSASGFQMIALALRDERLGAMTGLGDDPSSLYAEVAKVADVPLDVAKHGAMTTIYGIEERGLARDLVNEYGVDYDDARQMARKVQAAIWTVLGDSAKSLFDRLQTMGAAGALEWTTPSGFTVANAPRKRKTLRPSIVLADGRRVWYRAEEVLDDFDARKARRSIVANLVHSLDAALCTYIIDGLDRAGADFVATAHDAFSVSPNDGDALYAVPREAVRIAFKRSPLEAILGGSLGELVASEGLPEAFTLRYLTA